MGERNWNALEVKLENLDRDQLILLGQELHDRALFEALAGVISKLKAGLNRCVDYVIGSYRLRHN